MSKSMLHKVYVVREVYKLELLNRGSVEDAKFIDLLWKLPVPSKIKDLVWRLVHNRLQTMDNLKKTNIIPNATDLNCVLL